MFFSHCRGWTCLIPADTATGVWAWNNLPAQGPAVSWHSRIRGVHLAPPLFSIGYLFAGGGTFHNQVLCEILVCFWMELWLTLLFVRKICYYMITQFDLGLSFWEKGLALAAWFSDLVAAHPLMINQGFFYFILIFFVIDWSSIDNKHGNGKISLIKPPCMWTFLHSTILAIYPFRVSDWSLNWTQGSGKHKKKIHQEGSVCAGTHSHNLVTRAPVQDCCFSIPVRKPRASGQRLASF